MSGHHALLYKVMKLIFKNFVVFVYLQGSQDGAIHIGKFEVDIQDVPFHKSDVLGHLCQADVLLSQSGVQLVDLLLLRVKFILKVLL